MSLCIPKLAADKKLQREKLIQKWNELGQKTEEKMSGLSWGLFTGHSM